MSDQVKFEKLLYAISEQVGYPIDEVWIEVYGAHLSKYGYRYVNVALTEMYCVLKEGDPFPTIQRIETQMKRFDFAQLMRRSEVA